MLTTVCIEATQDELCALNLQRHFQHGAFFLASIGGLISEVKGICIPTSFLSELCDEQIKHVQHIAELNTKYMS